MMREPARQPARTHQPDSQPAWTHQPDSQPASGQGVTVKTEPLDYSEEGGVDFRCDFSYDPGLSVDWCSSSGESQAALKCEDPEPSSEEQTTPQQPVDLRISLHRSANTSHSHGQQPQNKGFRCQRCGTRFTLFSFLKQHMASVHGEKVTEQDCHLPEEAPEEDVLPVFFAAPEGCGDVGRCGNSDIETKNGDRITKTVGREKDQAKSTETDRTGLENVKSRHSCEICSKTFSNAWNLKKHMFIHTGHKKVACDECSMTFTQIASLKRHKLIHTGLREFVCDVCNKAFTRAGDLKEHKLIHTGLKEFVCDLCNSAFSRAGSLKRHKMIHADEKQFVCDVCSKAFTLQSHLKSHMFVHTGHKPFVCDVCNKAFSIACNLKQHKLIHSGVKEHVCDVCSKAFTESGHLKRHKLIHTGHKKFVCDVCFRAFTQSGTMKRHKRIHEGERAKSSKVPNVKVKCDTV